MSKDFKISKKDRLQKIYLENNVFDETMKRIELIYSMYDHIFISFSGGKDSLLCLKLFELYQKANGITKKLNVIFYDEELVDTFVLKYCEDIMNSGKYNFQWWCAPLESEKFILGKKEKYIQWDPDRQHIRPIPAWAKTVKSGVRKQEEMYKEYTKGYRGKICCVLGLRTDESINRLRGIFATRNKLPYINTETKNVTVVKPVYDWSEKDLFKFFYDFGITYCDTYDRQVFNGDPLRVSTPLHAEASKSALLSIKTKDPMLYNQMITVFPEIELQIRYYKQYDKRGKTSNYDKYEKSWAGVIQFARDVVSDDLIDEVVSKIIYSKRSRKRYEDKRPLGGYPILYMFETIAKGRYKRMIPMMHSDAVKKKHYEFENLEYIEYIDDEH